MGTPPVMDTACRVHARVRKDEGGWSVTGQTRVGQASGRLSFSHLDALQARDEEEVHVGRPVELLPQVLEDEVLPRVLRCDHLVGLDARARGRWTRPVRLLLQ